MEGYGARAAEPGATAETASPTEVTDPRSGLTLTVPLPLQASVDSAGIHLRHQIPYRHRSFCDQSDGPHPWYDTMVDFLATIELRPSSPVSSLAAMRPYLADRVRGDSLQTTAGYLDAVLVGGRPGFREQNGVAVCGAATYWLAIERESLCITRVSIPMVTPIYKYRKDVLAVPGALTAAVADSLFEATVKSARIAR